MVAATVCLVPAVLVLLPACVVLAVMMLPTAAALCIDRGRISWLALSVGPPNLCGAVFPFLEFWRRGRGFDAAFEVLLNPYGWLMALAGAAFGWMIYLAMPAIILRIMSTRQRLRLAQLRTAQAALAEEWGGDVAEGGAETRESA